MPSVKVKDPESFDFAMKQFKKQCEREGILSEVKKRESYDKPSVKRKKKIIAARKKAAKRSKFSSSRSR
ncbi:MAG: small subunit ribosomal protein S21 [Nitrospirae bacterium]|nr:MAG: small subunit ribosomal protein S21 [Nitrospirota bacterium]